MSRYGQKRPLAFILGSLLLGVLLAAACGDDSDSTLKPALDQCIEHETISKHTHASFFPVLNGVPQILPGGVGVTADCLRPLHTHGTDFIIHIESPLDQTFVVGDFFDVWGDDNPYRDMPAINVSVNGQRYEGDYRTVVLEDDLRLVIEFSSR